jgi:hypothetical protein
MRLTPCKLSASDMIGKEKKKKRKMTKPVKDKMVKFRDVKTK